MRISINPAWAFYGGFIEILHNISILVFMSNESAEPRLKPVINPCEHGVSEQSIQGVHLPSTTFKPSEHKLIPAISCLY
jgi:hypothetical protein